MIELVACPHCQRIAFDAAAGQCLNCSMLAGETDVLDEAKLASLLYNVRIHLQNLDPHQFEQITAALSPRPGMGDDDAIPFTETTCRMTHRYLVAHGIRCIQINIIANGEVIRSLAFAHTQTGLDRCVRAARKLASRQRFRLYIMADPDD